MSWTLIFLFAFAILIGWALLKRRRQQRTGAGGTSPERATGSLAQTSDTGASRPPDFRPRRFGSNANFQSEINEAIAELRELYRLVRMFPFYRYKARNTLADQLTSQLKMWCRSQKLPDAGVDWRMRKPKFEHLLRQIAEARQVPSVDEALDVLHVNQLHDRWLRVARESNFDLGSRPISLFELNLAWALKFGGPIVQDRWEHAKPYQTGSLAQTSNTVASSRPSKAAPVPTKSTPPSVVESVSVVLRRQLPVRWEEPARSWIGGLPRMPESVAWPLGPTIDYPERGLTPLHFVAQIACADLPPDLWGGLGPREGWLLLFLNAQNWDVMDNPEAVRVLHIGELGPERAPPPGIYPVHDEMYTGARYDFVRAQADIPTVWRRWPLDLVTIPNRVIEGAPTPAIIPENFASILYDGAPVKDEGRVEPSGKVPFSWRGTLYVVDSIARVLAKAHELRLGNIPEKLSAPGWIVDAINRTDAQIAGFLASWSLHPTAENASEAEKIRPSVLDRIEKLRAGRQLLAESADAATLLARMEQTHRDYAAWRDGAKQRVAALRERIVAHDLDTPIAAEDWNALRAALENDRQPYWWALDNTGDGLLPEPIDQSLLDYARDGLHAAQVQLAADYYVSRDLHHLVPAELVAFMEPRWRALYSNRPHRMGGLHDGIQSEAKEGPTQQVLLFQIATDDAMHWVWGDAGAYYIFIDTDRLAAGDFSKLDATFENH